jgi:hypothetical protein
MSFSSITCTQNTIFHPTIHDQFHAVLRHVQDKYANLEQVQVVCYLPCTTTMSLEMAKYLPSVSELAQFLACFGGGWQVRWYQLGDKNEIEGTNELSSSHTEKSVVSMDEIKYVVVGISDGPYKKARASNTASTLCIPCGARPPKQKNALNEEDKKRFLKKREWIKIKAMVLTDGDFKLDESKETACDIEPKLVCAAVHTNLTAHIDTSVQNQLYQLSREPQEFNGYLGLLHLEEVWANRINAGALLQLKTLRSLKCHAPLTMNSRQVFADVNAGAAESDLSQNLNNLARVFLSHDSYIPPTSILEDSNVVCSANRLIELQNWKYVNDACSDMQWPDEHDYSTSDFIIGTPRNPDALALQSCGEVMMLKFLDLVKNRDM